MEWLFALIIVVVIAAAFFASRGKFGTMPDVVVDQPGIDLPEGILSGEDLKEVKFSVVTRGYQQDQVDCLLARLADQLDGVNKDEDLTKTTAVEDN